MDEDTFDVGVVGAGPAGSATAYHLATHGLRVALMDRSEFPRDKTCGDALTPRAVRALMELGALDDVSAYAYRCNSITLRHSDAIEYRLPLSMPGLPDYVLVLPRLALDDLLRRRALRAGARFIAGGAVKSISRETGGPVTVRFDGGRTLHCALVVMATGANTTLLRDAGLLEAQPPFSLAARGYFENVDGIEDSAILFFDGVALPGYGWMFPTSPTTANIGCGAFFRSANPQAGVLRELIETHPYLRRVLRNARQCGPIRGYPLRTDFSASHGGNDWALVVGEALGLVNPLTGEGIDYALESARLAADAIISTWTGTGSPDIQRHYRVALRKRFGRQFAHSHLARKIYFRPGRLENLLARGQGSAYLRRALVEVAFGAGNPAVMLSPRTLWAVFGPSRNGG